MNFINFFGTTVLIAFVLTCLFWFFTVPREAYEPPKIETIQVEPDTLKIEERPIWVMPEVVEIDVVVTIYHAVEGQTDSDPDVLADGTRIDISRAGEYRFCALSRDLLERWNGPFAYGDTIVVEGAGRLSGKWVVRDTMNKRWKRRVDLLVDLGTRHYKFEEARIRRMI